MLNTAMRIDAHEQSWPLDKPFRIARGSRTEARVVVVTVTSGQYTGRGEAVPIARYGQTVESVLAQIESMKREKSLDRQKMQRLLPAGAARNALDCALWDLEAKISGKRAWELADFVKVHCSRRLVGDEHPSHCEPATERTFGTGEVETSFTISLDTPEALTTAAKA